MDEREMNEHWDCGECGAPLSLDGVCLRSGCQESKPMDERVKETRARICAEDENRGLATNARRSVGLKARKGESS